ncbi:MAG: 3-deoxy-7-phosphoheptulonate synthase [Acidaminococcaceae bacterium]|nr:3-deoxy-7-phosphoheptulonate synthase [Acidaminococcaceae bacterium]HAY61184.1 3-deoxy-7-phosphoheptulonate synthase [Acidaminococcaceae bacterium]HCJ91388.1 3-deoxy-7-phosphoheptulonate synthase [Acidaminococcaceae bacterium]
MIIVMKPNAPVEERDRIISRLQERGYKIDISAGNQRTILGIIGDTSVLNPHDLMVNDWIEKVMRVEEPFKRANRAFHPEDTVVDVGGVKIGGRTIQVMAGPCSVETRDQVVGIAKSVKMAGAHLLRGGAFKPRTSPYSFQGLGAPGLDLLKEAREETGLPVVTELMSTDMLDRFVEDVDMIQVGARNMQNYTLLRELGRTRKPVLLKRGLAATVQEWLMSAEYIMAEGNPNVVLCERGIRTFEDYTRNTLDLSAVLAAKKLSHLPVVVDPSHAAGLWWMVPQLAKAAVAAGADGLLIEVHNDPEKALCDGAQSLKPERFAELMGELKGIARIIGRDL